MLVRLVDVYDGDTFTVLLLHDRRVCRRRCRCLGYDAPELKGPTADMASAIAAREHLKTLIPSSLFKLEYAGTDKYGRLLVTFMVGKETLAQHMIRMGHGYEYNGGKKRATAGQTSLP